MMRVMTYNIHGWLGAGDQPNVEQLAEVIAASGADVVGLNEVYHPWRHAGQAALDALARRLGMACAFGPALTAAESPRQVPYGNALLSRWPILAYAAHHLPAPANGERRSLLEARLRLPSSQPITVYVTHLDHRAEAARLAQWAAAATWLGRDRSRPHLLMGDFNALSEADYPEAWQRAGLVERNQANGWSTPDFALTTQVRSAGYTDACALPGQAAAFTWPTDAPDRRIDYIWLPAAAISAVGACGPWMHPLVEVASDHRPVLAELDWPGHAA